MASIIKGKIKIFPSGLSSVVFSHIPKDRGGHKGGGGCEQLFPDFETGELRTIGTISSEWDSPSLGNRAKIRQGDSLENSDWHDSPRPGHGSLGNKVKASWKSGRNVRERMAAVEAEYGYNKCLLLTVTLPSVCELAYEALARYSSYAMDRLNREFNRDFGSKNIARVSAWEYQKRGALHCHILIAGDCIHAIKPSEFSERYCDIWHRILMDIGNKFDADMFLRKDGKQWKLSQLKAIRNKKGECVFVNCQKVYKSVVAYLSKYLADSNHEEKEGDKNKLREKFYPIATWFQWNRKATELYHKYMDEFDLGECEPDKIDIIKSSLNMLKKSVEKRVILAEDTEVKRPKKPYVYGLYWIPDVGGKSIQNAKIIAEYIAKMIPFFREDMAKEGNKEWEQKEIIYPSYPSLDVELSCREYELNCSISQWRLSDFRYLLDLMNMFDLAAKFALKMVDIFRDLRENIEEMEEKFSPIQLSLNLENL